MQRGKNNRLKSAGVAGRKPPTGGRILSGLPQNRNNQYSNVYSIKPNQIQSLSTAAHSSIPTGQKLRKQI